MSEADKKARDQVVFFAAAVAAHGLVARYPVQSAEHRLLLVQEAFDLAEAFIAEAERRYGKLPGS